MTRNRFAACMAMMATLGAFSAGCKGGSFGFASRQKSLTAARAARSNSAAGSAQAVTARNSAAPASRAEFGHTAPATSSARRPTKPQLTCPVSGKTLGIESAPIVTIVNGEPIFVCSQACLHRVQQDPDRYLAKVRAEVARRE